MVVWNVHRIMEGKVTQTDDYLTTKTSSLPCSRLVHFHVCFLTSLMFLSWHASAVKMRINRYCHAASLLGLSALSSLEGCNGMNESYEECLADGTCPYCNKYEGVATHNLTNYVSEEALPTDASLSTEEEPDVDESSENPTTSPVSLVLSTSAPTKTPVSSPLSTSVPTKGPISSPLSTFQPTITPTSLELSTSTPTVFTFIMATSKPKSSSPTRSPSLTISESTPSVASPDATPTITPIPPPVETMISASPTTSPTLVASTKAPTTSTIFNSTQEPTLEPSYSPTTPQPTLGPCDGDPCPANLCRSVWGFCGDGDGYCNDNAIWSPSCKEDSTPPTPTPTSKSTSSPTTLSTFAIPGYSDSTAMGQTNKPTVSKTFVKPVGVKKPPPGKTKPSSNSDTSSQTSTQKPSSSEEQGGAAASTTPLKSSTPSNVPTPAPTETLMTNVPTMKPTLKEYSPTDPESTFFCGKDWADANKNCAVRCPSAKSEDCPEGHSCYAFTSCNDVKSPNGPDNSPKDTPQNDNIQYDEVSDNSEEVDLNNPTPDQTESPVTIAPTAEPTKRVGCTGKPCQFTGECRSQYGFCGSSFIYCNDLSSWTLEKCGLAGVDVNGTAVLCDAETFECPDGKSVQRDPSNNCEFFACPAEESPTTQFSSAFKEPANSPATLPELPKPTLPTITKPNPLEPTPAAKPTNIIILPSVTKPASDSQTVVIVGKKDQVEDDKQESFKNKNGNATSDSAEPSNNKQVSEFGTFSAEEWLLSGGHSRRRVQFNFLLPLAVSLMALLYYQ